MPSHFKFEPLAPELLGRQGEPDARTGRNSKSGTVPSLLLEHVSLSRASLTARVTSEINTKHASGLTNDRMDKV